MIPNVTLQPIGSLAWAYIDSNLFFTREIGFNYKAALKRITGSDLSLAIPYGMLNPDSNHLIVDFEDEYLYAPYSTALKGLRDLEYIDDYTIIRFHGFERKASLVFKEIVKFERQELLNGLDRDLEYTFKSWGR